MEFEKTEVVKWFEYYFNEIKLKVSIKIKMTEDGSIFYEPSHYYKPNGASDYYRPGAGANSVDDAIRKAENYLRDFTKDYIGNISFC